MKLTALLLTAIILQVSATTLAQKVTLKETNIPLGLIFNKISSQTGYDFLYTTSLLRSTKPVTIDVKNAELSTVLKQIFAGQPLDFSIEDKSVVVTPRLKPDLRPGKLKSQTLIDVKGTIVDSASRRPLPGAGITIKGTNRGLRADDNGFFFTNSIDENAILIITYLGYQYKEVRAAKDMGIIALAPVANNLTEVAVTVNTGYQRINPEQSTGSVAQIGTKAYESSISTNFLEGLVNRLPGLLINNNVSFTSTTPGSTGSTSRSLFNVRGISTMSANQSPLIVIDGYPTELTLDRIDPNEIKSVTVLKDAAAATIYGVRASNGVIIVERKQAVAGRPSFSFRTTTGITPKENYNRYRFADDASAIKIDYEKALYSNSVNPTTWSNLSRIGGGLEAPRSPLFYLLAQSAANVITPEQFASSYAALQGYDNKNEYSKLFLRPAVSQTYTLDASGGNENALYYLTANYTGNRQTQINNDNNKWSLSGRTTLKLASRLSLELTTDYLEIRSNGAPVPDLITSLNPYEHLQDVNGNPMYSTLGSATNPFLNQTLMGKGLQDVLYYPLVDVNQISDKSKTVNNIVTANFNYKLGDGFGLLFGGIYESSSADIRHYASEFSSESRRYVAGYAKENADGTLTYGIPQGGYLRQGSQSTYSYTGRVQLNYNKRMGSGHSINGIVGGEIRNVVNKDNIASYFGYSDETLLQQPVDYAAITNGTANGTLLSAYPFQRRYNTLFDQSYTEDRFLSAFSNVVYSYKDTYSLSGSVRIDQSNLFGTNPKYKYKPLLSVGARWNINKESFMQQVDWLNQLTLRSSYGFNGNVAKLSLPQVIGQYIQNSDTSPTSTALRLLSYANSSLRWEQTKNFNSGLDYRIFRNVSGTVDYYLKNSTDLLGNALIDPTIGLSPSIINTASIHNKGLEISLHADWIARKDFNWNTGFIFARNTSKVVEVNRQGPYNPQTLNSIGYVKGYPVGALFAYRYAGLNSAGYPQVKNEQGKLYQTDNSTDPTQNSLLASDTSGVTRYVGSSIPTINAGLSNRIDIGRFYVFVMVNYYGGFKVRVPAATPFSNRPLEGAGNYWKNPGDESNTDIPSLAALNSTNSTYAYNYSDRNIVNGDYITLGELTFSYSFDDKKFIKNLGFSHFEVKLQGSNLWTKGFNKYNYSSGAGGFEKSYITPTYRLAIFTNF
ncbi:SusC/RagA family TonB-linked outer membrane protein [Pedobacter hartonius]|nr:SusC/RagA family TonB-linked outer membrane protein [Pedobacter hartonius]